MTEPLFRTQGLSVNFGGLAALTHLDLEVNEHSIVGLIGPNGAGKTTAFNAITSVVKVSAGKTFFNGTDITGWRSSKIAAFGVARTFQNIRLYEDLTVLENVMIAGHTSIRYTIFESILRFGRYAGDEARIRKHAMELLGLMNLAGFAGEKAKSLPYGSQRKLEIARALALEPKLLLLDEPVAGMNPGETREFINLMKRIRKDLGLTIALIEHDMRFVMGICDYIKVIDHGLPIAWGPPDEIRKNDRVIAAYLGESKD